MSAAKYRAGADLERAAKKELEANGYYVVRSAGSKGPADLVALKFGEILFVQCKVDGKMTSRDRYRLWSWARGVGATGIIASWWKEGREARKLHFASICKAEGMTTWLYDWTPDWALEES